MSKQIELKFFETKLKKKKEIKQRKKSRQKNKLTVT